MHIVTAAEALRRYDEEHVKPSAASEAGSSEGSTGWISDSEEVHLTVVGSAAELRIQASQLRAVDRPTVCKRALDVLRSDLDVLAGHLESAPETPMVDSKEGGVGTGAADFGGGGGGLEEDGGGRDDGRSSLVPIFPASADRAVRMIMPPVQGFPEIIGGVRAGQHPAVSAPGASEMGMPKRRRQKKKAVVAEDGNVYDLPTYVQNVNKKERSTLRLKMPLSGFLVRGEDISVADLVVACGLDVTRRNLLALRSVRGTGQELGRYLVRLWSCRVLLWIGLTIVCVLRLAVTFCWIWWIHHGVSNTRTPRPLFCINREVFKRLLVIMQTRMHVAPPPCLLPSLVAVHRH